ncbi:hypothetical protein SteCoe_18978 [Stentor coeruleus]|uniref:Peptidase S1 domain-containing protein n=1 Tax=Stentor coeruleus TaxID=5963 RepID=A0A1R2BVS2_9CILI|nr:hypothetical protein SteCoe_18978 [Stentor coeruleus]
MGDLLLYQMDPYSIGEIVITFNPMLGVVVNPKTKVYDKKNFSVFYHELGGTVFVYKLCEPPIEIIYGAQNTLEGSRMAEKEFIIGFALTAAHTVINPVSKQFRLWRLQARSLNSEIKINLMPIKNMCIEFPDELLTSEGIKYMLPGDLCILAIISTKALNLKEIPRASCTGIEDCYTIGVPSIPRNSPRNFYPYTDNDLIAYNELNRIFFGGGKLIKSYGSVIACNELIQFTCSAMCGMSGSPIISKKGLIGVLVGGPVLPGQRELLLCSELVFNGKYTEAWEKLGQLSSLNTEYDKPIFQKLVTKKEIRLMFAELITSICDSLPSDLLNESLLNFTHFSLEQAKSEVIRTILDCSYRCLRYGKKKENYSNTGISVESAIFRRIDEIVNQFIEQCQGRVEFKNIFALRDI